MEGSTLFDSLIIEQLKTFIEDEYSEGTQYYHFAITKIEFNCNQKRPQLCIEVSHFKSEKKVLFTFNHFELQLVADEDKIPYFDSQNFQGFSFIHFSYSYNIFDWLKSNGYDAQFILHGKNPIDFFVIRILAQNYFVDVLTDKMPQISFNIS